MTKPKDQDFNKAEFEKEMKRGYSKNDIMVKGRKVNFENSIRGHKISELMYGDKYKKTQNNYLEIWENFRRYN